MAHDVLDHDHCPVHNHAEIERTEREQVRGNVVQIEQNRGEQQCERDGHRNDEGSSDVAKEDEQNDRHQDDAFGQVMKNGLGGELYEIASVQKRNNLHAGRKNAVVQIMNLLMKSLEHFVCFCALAKKHDAFHNIPVVHDNTVFGVDRLTDLAQPNLRAFVDGGDVPDANWGAILSLQQRLSDLARHW